MFEHILCPTDLKERAYIALKKAVQIAHQFNSKITILNVHPEFMAQEDREMLGNHDVSSWALISSSSMVP